MSMTLQSWPPIFVIVTFHNDRENVVCSILICVDSTQKMQVGCDIIIIFFFFQMTCYSHISSFHSY